MSGNNLFNPDQAAVDTRWIQPWSEAYRAQRDVALHVPINFHTAAGVSLTQACFAEKQYEHTSFRKCLSNLLGVGFRRLEADVYWDSSRSIWSLCPVQLDIEDAEENQTMPVSTGSTVVLSSEIMSAHLPESTFVAPGGIPKFKRQDGSTTTSTAASTPAVSSSVGTIPAQPTIITFPTISGPPLIQAGSYNCTTSVTLDLLTGVLEDFLDDTATTTGAAITILIINVHAASSLNDPDAPALAPSDDNLPGSGALLSDVLKGNLSSDTYTQSKLRQEQSNINYTWWDVDWDNRPARGYYQTSVPNNVAVAGSGWPTEAYMEFKEFYRVLTGFGRLDPQMQNYNISADLDYMFPPGYLMDYIPTTTNSNGDIASGCLFDPGQDKVTSMTNSSWAVSVPQSMVISTSPDQTMLIPSVMNVTSCGISPFLNQSLANVTADQDPIPYAAFVQSTLWSWAPGEPLNVTNSSNTNNRCAVMSTSPYPGRWRVEDCAAQHLVACQDPSQPYNWQISSSKSDYNLAEEVCGSSHRFSVPHTALENAHLLAAMQSAPRVSASSDSSIFLNINSLNVPDCWVIGQNGTCPYLPSSDTNKTRIVVVPTIAAVIIFVLAALTFFVKCAANRREDKRGRKRKMLDGWEYEGVPS